MIRVLVVDDDKDILRMAEAILKEAKYEVHTAQDAVYAMELINSMMFDAVITDANMPQYSGFDLVQTIRGNKRFENTSIAMLTGLRDKKNIDKAIRAGVDDYIVKPIDPIILLKKMEGLFAKRPPEARPQVDLPEASTNSEAQFYMSSHIKSVSESGVVIQCSYKIEDGFIMQLESIIFEKMQISSPRLKVISSFASDEGFEIQMGFIGLKENEREKVRKWVYSNNAKNKRHAA